MRRHWEKATAIELRQREIEKTERKRQMRVSDYYGWVPDLPVLAYVPFIELTENSKYRMEKH